MTILHRLAQAALGAAFLFPATASADTARKLFILPCASPAEMDSLLAKFGEQRLAVGTDPLGLVELRVNPKTATYTILLNTRDGLTCILGAGKNFAITGTPPSKDGVPI